MAPPGRPPERNERLSPRTVLAAAAIIALLLAIWAVAVGTHGVVAIGGESERIVRDTRADAGSSGARGPRGLKGKAGNGGAAGPAGKASARGPAGKRGVAGASSATDGQSGATGDQGSDGSVGAKGETGAHGERGQRGEAGAAAAAGARGDTGANGDQGVPGVAGAEGPRGLQGLQGLVGPPGAAGTNGTNGTNGAPGGTGADGAKGDTGDSGAKGDTGAPGPQGPQGADGAAGTATTADEVYRDEDVALPPQTNVTVATMSTVAAGRYLVLAKTTLVQTNDATGGIGSSGVVAGTRCTLNGDPSSNSPDDDYAEVELGRVDRGNETGRATLQTQLTVNLSNPGDLTLVCRTPNALADSDIHLARETKIIAVKLNGGSRQAVTG